MVDISDDEQEMNMQTHYEQLFETDEIIEIPIKKLWGIKCTVFINEKVLSIHSDNFYDSEDNCKNIRLFRQKLDSFEEAKSIIKNIKLDNYLGKFALKNNNRDDVTYWSDVFKNDSHIEFIGHECCICFQKFTATQTNCGHALCLQCADQIKPIQDEDEDNEIIPCPLCRADITFGCNFG